MSKLTKKDFESFIKKRYNISNEVSSQVVEGFFQTIITLANQDGATLKNFGKFQRVEIKSTRKIYNIQKKVVEEKTVEKSKIHFLKSRNVNREI